MRAALARARHYGTNAMLYEFKSKATGTVVMTEKVAERLLGIIGKSPGATGIIIQDQMPAAIAALEAAVAREGSAPTVEPQDDSGNEPDGGHEPRGAVTLAQRAWPLLDMMRAALAAKREITWGV